MMETDNKVGNQNLISRLSKLQKEILRFLARVPSPTGTYIGNLPRTGNIIEGLGRERTPANYAAISKALKRLEARGLVSSAQSELALPGMALRYYLTRGERVSGRNVDTVFILSKPKPKRRYRNSMTIDA